MAWQASAHVAFQRELAKLPRDAVGRIKEALARVVGELDSIRSLDPRKIYASGSLMAIPDLKPLLGTGVPGSYRLRVGDYRLALAILPDEKLVLLTSVARRSGSTYDKLPELHRRRFHDR